MEEIIGIDTSVFIYLFEGQGEYAKKAELVLSEVERGKKQGVFSSVGLIELLVGTKREGRDDLVLQYKELITRFPHLAIVGINENIVDIASDVRAKYSIGTPDAIHIATAIDSGAKTFITNDAGLRKIKEIAVELL